MLAGQFASNQLLVSALNVSKLIATPTLSASFELRFFYLLPCFLTISFFNNLVFSPYRLLIVWFGNHFDLNALAITIFCIRLDIILELHLDLFILSSSS